MKTERNALPGSIYASTPRLAIPPSHRLTVSAQQKKGSRWSLPIPRARSSADRLAASHPSPPPEHVPRRKHEHERKASRPRRALLRLRVERGTMLALRVCVRTYVRACVLAPLLARRLSGRHRLALFGMTRGSAAHQPTRSHITCCCCYCVCVCVYCTCVRAYMHACISLP